MFKKKPTRKQKDKYFSSSNDGENKSEREICRDEIYKTLRKKYKNKMDKLNEDNSNEGRIDRIKFRFVKMGEEAKKLEEEKFGTDTRTANEMMIDIQKRLRKGK